MKPKTLALAIGAGSLVVGTLAWLGLRDETPAPAAKVPTPPPVTPVPTGPSGSALPPHGVILLLGDQTGDPILNALATKLKDYAALHPEYLPNGMSGWVTSGATYADAAATLKASGVPQLTDGAGKAVTPDIILVDFAVATLLATAGGSLDAQKAAISYLASTLPSATKGRHPSIFWIVPPNYKNDGYLGLQIAITTNAIANLSSPLSSSMIVGKVVPKDQQALYFYTDGTLTAYGADDFASQIAAAILKGAPDAPTS